MTKKILKIKRQLLDIYQKIRDLRTFEGKDTDALTNQLKKICTTAPADISEKILLDRDISSKAVAFRKFYAIYGSSSESEWSKKIVDSSDPEKELLTFPSYKRYARRVALEYYFAQSLTEKPVKKCLFIGGGPLPLTAILMHRLFNVRVDILDIDAQAVIRSKKILRALGLNNYVKVYRCDAYLFERYRTYDYIVMAAMVGQTPKQKNILIKKIGLQIKHNAVLSVRSSCDLKKLLYTPVEQKSFDDLKMQFIWHPCSSLNTNSNIIYQKEKTYGRSR